MEDNEQAAVVLRYRNGSTARGTEVPVIDIGRQAVRLADSEISFDELKAVFFLKESVSPQSVDSAHASVVSVEFHDGEVIRGRAFDYNPLAAGFYLSPLEESKSDRIFVVSSAVMAIEVEKL